MAGGHVGELRLFEKDRDSGAKWELLERGYGFTMTQSVAPATRTSHHIDLFSLRRVLQILVKNILARAC